jgi:hypothetical protein
LDNDNLTLPCEFSFEAGCQDGRFLEILNILIHPCILPTEFSGGRLNHSLKPREEIKELAQTSRVFQYVCSPTVYTWPFTPTTVAHPTFNSWWQEFHDHIFSEPMHSFCIELMPDFQPTSEVT